MKQKLYQITLAKAQQSQTGWHFTFLSVTLKVIYHDTPIIPSKTQNSARAVKKNTQSPDHNTRHT